MLAFKPKDPRAACPYAMGRYQCWADLKTLAHPLRQGYGCKCNGTGNHDPGDEHHESKGHRFKQG